ncbi:MAG: tetratricopeptide repeat protein, partial [Thermoanaerobaculia bacterium]
VRLHQVAGAQIIPPSALGGLAERQNVQAVAREFGANLVLTTTLWRSSGQIRASYSLLNPAGRQIASGTVHGTIGNLFDFGDLIAERIAGSLELPRLPVPNRGGLRTAEVQDRFFQAVGAMHRYDDPASVDFAIALLEPMAEANPESALLHAALGRAYRAKYALTSDSAWAERAIETSRRAARLDRSLPEVHVTLGQLLIMTGRFDDAAAELRQALAMRPDDPEAMLWLGQALDQAGESDEAESTYRAAIALRPTYWAGYNKLGIFYLLRGRFDDAIRMLSEVARLTPDNHRGLSNLGAAQMFSGDFESAAASFQRAIEVAPAAPGFSNLGTCLYYLHRFDEARAAFEKAVELAPADFRLWLNLADAYRWTGQPDEEREARDKGIELARRSLEINPNDPATHGQLVLSYALLGSEAQARRHLDRALSLAPDNPNVLIKAAILAEWEGDSAKALDWITRAVAAGYSKPMLANDPELRDLRGHPSFQKLIAPS